jgi:serine/threonine protein phosphatase PrpC
LEITNYTIQKSGETKKDNQDSFNVDKQNKIFAISDGVSRSSFSNIWSKKIVEEFIRNPFKINTIDKIFLEKWLYAPKLGLDEEISKLDISPMILDIAKEKGSAATFLGGEIKKERKRKKICLWAVGDTNIFQIRQNKINNLFPIKKAEEFISKTFAITSFLDKNNIDFLYTEWTIQSGDILVLATDAFSHWFLDSYLKGQRPWKKMKKNMGKMDEFIEKLRHDKKIENDDVTFIMIRC